MRAAIPALVTATALFVWTGESPCQEVAAGASHRADPQDSIDHAREAFVAGTKLAADMRWGEALAQFEQSSRIHPHPGTTYNVGVCQRALGQYARARQTFELALAQNANAGGALLAASVVADIAAFTNEIERIVGTLDVTLDPPSAAIAVDGRPLQLLPSPGGPPVLLAGTLPPGKGSPPHARRFRVVLDPGTHLVVVSRDGYRDIVRRIDLSPGTRETLDLRLSRLPGEIHIDATQSDAAVTLDGLDVGVAPVTLSRPAQRYRVVVRKSGFVDYKTDAVVSPGDRVHLRAVLAPEPVGLTQRWWFWTAVGVVITGTAAVTYWATRPEPERPPVDGGGLGWVVSVP